MADEARATIEITAELPARILSLTRFLVDIDGRRARMRWGRHAFEVDPGRHVISVRPDMAFSLTAVLEVSLAAGEEVRLRFVPRLLPLVRGKLTIDLPPTSCADRRFRDELRELLEN